MTLPADFPPPPAENARLAVIISWVFDLLMWLVARAAARAEGEAGGLPDIKWPRFRALDQAEDPRGGIGEGELAREAGRRRPVLARESVDAGPVDGAPSAGPDLGSVFIRPGRRAGTFRARFRDSSSRGAQRSAHGFARPLCRRRRGCAPPTCGPPRKISRVVMAPLPTPYWLRHSNDIAGGVEIAMDDASLVHPTRCDPINAGTARSASAGWRAA
jgi:hypothetical protein